MKQFQKIRPVGHREIAELFNGPVVVQEKIDGSNFSFGRTDQGLFCWSRTQNLDLNNAGMFQPAVDHVKRLGDSIPVNIIFRCEYLQKPKHNVLSYDRIPINHLVLFDWEALPGPEAVIGPSISQLASLAQSLSIEPVRELYRGDIRPETLAGWLSMWKAHPSQLGGQNEGVVIKNYNRWDVYGNTLIGKAVHAEFKEQHRHKTKCEQPDSVSVIGAKYGGPARWRKAIQRLRDEGTLTGGMEDMPNIMHRVKQDVLEEHEADLKEALFRKYKKDVLGGTIRGLPEFYKKELGLL